MNNNITKEWVLAYTSLSKGNVMDWEIEEDGVLRVDVWCLGRDHYRPDFVIDSSREVYADEEGGHQWANIKFVLPMPEDITSDGEADFNTLCDKAAGPDEIVFWDERLAVEAKERHDAINEKNMREWQEAFFESHRRTLSAAGDM